MGKRTRNLRIHFARGGKPLLCGGVRGLPWLIVTENPDEVTCKLCLRKLTERRIVELDNQLREVRAAWTALRDGRCAETIPGAYIACGEDLGRNERVYCSAACRWRAEVRKALALVDKLRAYVQHSPMCVLRIDGWPDERVCDCGLDELLGEPG